jgi:hypothetical protein
MFTPKDGREKYCPVCSELPIAQRKNQMRACPTCGKRFFPEHGPQQLHCRQECAWPALWNVPAGAVCGGNDLHACGGNDLHACGNCGHASTCSEAHKGITGRDCWTPDVSRYPGGSLKITVDRDGDISQMEHRPLVPAPITESSAKAQNS